MVSKCLDAEHNRSACLARRPASPSSPVIGTGLTVLDQSTAIARRQQAYWQGALGVADVREVRGQVCSKEVGQGLVRWALQSEVTPCGGDRRGGQHLMSNTTTLSGNLTRDPEIRYSREGQANATFGLAVNRRWQIRGSDEWEEATSFFDVVCWRDLAENVALSLVKGSRVVVTGRLDQHVWETDAGERRSRVEVTAEDVGASLRYATAEVSRPERRQGDDESIEGRSDPSADRAVHADA